MKIGIISAFSEALVIYLRGSCTVDPSFKPVFIFIRLGLILTLKHRFERFIAIDVVANNQIVGGASMFKSIRDWPLMRCLKTVAV